ELAQRSGRPVGPSTLYRILKRHGWRKVVPRPRHPDADPERQEAFKQIFCNRRERIQTWPA
ncbi:MAG TPA: winged helix-turn-helix domain-containing protein, partial [Solirubrobacteraceae bacterium]